jgi:wyosine [tRNA(Phe)-imidazoG37] synthetase (radical SAM superfamily)
MADATPTGSIVYGPVRSRRLGRSLGINLTPARSKLCTFNCPYCECGFNTERAAGARWPSPDEVGHALRRALQRSGQAPDWITVSGSGEPTMHPRCAVAIDRILAARDELARDARVGILTNGLAVTGAALMAALRRLDARMIKLDPGPAERVNGVGFDIAAVVNACLALAPVVIQAMVVSGADWDGASDASLAAWLPHVVRAGPATVQLYSLDRRPADARLRQVPRERLEQMALAIREALPRAEVLVF